MQCNHYNDHDKSWHAIITNPQERNSASSATAESFIKSPCILLRRTRVDPFPGVLRTFCSRRIDLWIRSCILIHKICSILSIEMNLEGFFGGPFWARFWGSILSHFLALESPRQRCWLQSIHDYIIINIIDVNAYHYCCYTTHFWGLKMTIFGGPKKGPKTAVFEGSKKRCFLTFINIMLMMLTLLTLHKHSYNVVIKHRRRTFCKKKWVFYFFSSFFSFVNSCTKIPPFWINSRPACHFWPNGPFFRTFKNALISIY